MKHELIFIYRVTVFDRTGRAVVRSAFSETPGGWSRAGLEGVAGRMRPAGRAAKKLGFLKNFFRFFRFLRFFRFFCKDR